MAALPDADAALSLPVQAGEVLDSPRPRAPLGAAPTSGPGARPQPERQRASAFAPGQRPPVPWARPAVSVPRVAPPGLRLEATVRAVRVEATPEQLWDHLLARGGPLCRARWPYRVEFSSHGPVQGCTRLALGPLLGLPGVLTRLEPGRYVDLQYCAGAFVGSLRWVRPKRLELRLQPVDGGATLLVLRLETLVHPLWRRPWRLAQRVRWGLVARRLRRAFRG